MDTIAEKLAALAPTQTFYGTLSWTNGQLDKPMYGKQKQGSSMVIVAPTGDIVYPIPDGTGGSTGGSTNGSTGGSTTGSTGGSTVAASVQPLPAPLLLLMVMLAPFQA